MEPEFSFRSKLLIAMMTIVAGVTLIILMVTNRGLQQSFDALFQDRFESETALVELRQEERLKGVRRSCALLTQSPRFQLLMRGYHREKENGNQERMLFFSERIYLTGENELSYVLESDENTSDESAARFFLVIDGEGDLVSMENESEAHFDRAKISALISESVKAKMNAQSLQKIPDFGYWIHNSDTETPELIELVTTLVVDAVDQELLGMFVVGFDATEANRDRAIGPKEAVSSSSGIWVDDRLFLPGLDPSLALKIQAVLGDFLRDHPAEPSGSMEVESEPVPGKVYFSFVDSIGSAPLFRISYFSMAEVIRSRQSSRTRIILTGASGLAIALVVGIGLSHGLSVPVRSLVSATRKVEAGDFTYRVDIRNRDELGLLAASFNRMTEGLGLKEKYRSILDKVTDRDVAAQLVNGEVELGGESVDVAVLFCDIRGFTAMTSGMEPDEVIRMLNEHFTPLTRVVAEHNGVVDKFVGDLIMAIFGAPKRYGNDSINAVRCAAAMIHERTKLNTMARYHITMGIGIASGPVVAGNMGSEKRLNYTVLGERVNLASRLCSQAGKMEVIIDDTTRARIEGHMHATPLPPVRLKGYEEKVSIHRLVISEEKENG